VLIQSVGMRLVSKEIPKGLSNFQPKQTKISFRVTSQALENSDSAMNIPLLSCKRDSATEG
jgi:hypothetical protein